MNGMHDVLQRFHQVLVEEITAKRPEYLDGPFTVAEIYQNLVPYGTHRDRLGVEMNGDYEDALLRLLAGEGGYVALESEPALRQLREELESSNPNTGLYREFAAVDVRLVMREPVAGGEGAASSPDFWGGESDDAMSISDLAPSAEEAPAPAPVPQVEAPVYEPPPPPAPPVAPPAAAGGPTAPHDGPEAACPWCRAELPARGNLNFCPYCGTDVHVVPCPGCGEELEPEWRFCISCGTEVSG